MQRKREASLGHIETAKLIQSQTGGTAGGAFLAIGQALRIAEAGIAGIGMTVMGVAVADAVDETMVVTVIVVSRGRGPGGLLLIPME